MSKSVCEHLQRDPCSINVVFSFFPFDPNICMSARSSGSHWRVPSFTSSYFL